MKKNKKEISRKTARKVNKKRLVLEKKYLRHSLVYNTFYFNVLKYLLEIKKKKYCYSDIKPFINQNTWETKLKISLKNKLKVIDGKKEGRVFYFNFDERKFLMHLFDEFVKYLIQELLAISPKIQERYSMFEEQKRNIKKKKHYINTALEKNNKQVVHQIVEPTKIINKTINIKDNKFQLPQEKDTQAIKNAFILWDDRLWKNKSKRDFALNFFQQVYTLPRYRIKEELSQRIIKQTDNEFSKIFKKFETTFYKSLNYQSCKAFCDVFDGIVYDWNEEARWIYEYPNNEQILGKNKGSIELLLYQICFILRRAK